MPVVRRDWVISHGKRLPTKAEALEAANAANERIGKQKQVEEVVNQAEQRTSRFEKESAGEGQACTNCERDRWRPRSDL